MEAALTTVEVEQVTHQEGVVLNVFQDRLLVQVLPHDERALLLPLVLHLAAGNYAHGLVCFHLDSLILAQICLFALDKLLQMSLHVFSKL
jgi:hypothetical protein